jgi:Bacterial Ig-like domain (group 3)/Beta-propeller repeat
VKFLTRTGAYNMFLTGDEAVLVLRERKDKKDRDKDKFSVETPLAASPAKANSTPTPERATESILRMKLRNANATAKVTGMDEQAGTSNYFIGNDPAKWRTNVPTYSKVKYEGIYSGIDLVFYGNQRQLEYDFIVAPGVDPHRIAFDISGAKRIRKDEHGDLVFKTGEGEIRWHKPVAYQEKDGARQLVAARYAITDRNRVGFEVANYDVGRPLYIDPLIYSTYLGGSSDDVGFGIALDSAGNAYVTGHTYSTDFPTKNPLQGANTGSPTVFVAKLNPTGSALVYSTYLGGSGGEAGNGIVVDSAGNAYVVGFTYSTDFPTTPGAFQTKFGGPNDAFVTKINPAGSALVYSTYLGGSTGSFDQEAHGIAVDSAGNAYVTGWTSCSDFPTMNPLQAAYGGGPEDAFVTKLNPTGSALVYSTFLGGSDYDFGTGIAVDSAGDAYVIGRTYSTDFPTKNPLQAAANGGQADAFVAKLNPAGSAFVYSTYLGGSLFDQGSGIAVDSAGNAYVIGDTDSDDFPTTKNAAQPAISGSEDAFVAKLNPTGSSLVYSTYLGGSDYENGYGIAVNSTGSAFLTGSTSSTDFPTTKNAAQPANGGRADAFAAKLDPTGSAFVYSTYLGGSNSDQGWGIAVDSAGKAYITGLTCSTDFPITPGAFQTNLDGDGSCNEPNVDAFVTKTSMPAETPTTTTLSSSLNPSTFGEAVTFISVVTSSIGAPPDGETVTLMEGTKILGTGALSSGSASFTTSALPIGTDPITAVYGGDLHFVGNKSTAVNQVVNKYMTRTALVSSLNPSGSGQAVKFTATVSSPSGGMPTGSLVFKNGTTTLATKTLSGGIASYATTALPLGSNSITAVYGGSSSYSGSTSAPVIQVVLTATTTTLSSSPNPSAYGQAVTFTATVTSSVGAPPDGETVTFMKGITVLGTKTLSGGSASFRISTLPAATSDIKVVYGGDSKFASSTSKVLYQVVGKATTTTTLVSSQNPSNFGQSVTFTAKVTPQFSGTVRGAVIFYDGTTALKTAYLSGDVAKFTTSTLASGKHSIRATYNGSTSFTGSSASLTQTVN